MNNWYGPCQYVCDNKSPSGYCNSTACTNPKYNGSGTVVIFSKETYDHYMMEKNPDYGRGINS